MERLTKDKEYQDLKDICEGLEAVGQTPAITHLRYIKLAEYEQTVPERADYGKQTLKELSKALTNEFGKGFSVSNIQFMRRFYQAYQIQQTASVKSEQIITEKLS